MHSMPKSIDTSSIANPVHATFGPPRVPSRKPRDDTALAEAVDIAKTAITEFADVHDIGAHLGVTADDERLVTHRFVAKVPGYGGWEFFATLARAPRAKNITVCETGMLPGENAIVAPDWVPWMERASEEERIRLDAIAAGEDPAKALSAAGYVQEKDTAHVPEGQKPSETDQAEKKKQARRDAKRRRAKQKAARQKKKSGDTAQKATKA